MHIFLFLFHKNKNLSGVALCKFCQTNPYASKLATIGFFLLMQCTYSCFYFIKTRISRAFALCKFCQTNPYASKLATIGFFLLMQCTYSCFYFIKTRISRAFALCKFCQTNPYASKLATRLFDKIYALLTVSITSISAPRSRPSSHHSASYRP